MNVLWIAVGIVLFGVFLDMEINESRFDFRCDVNKNAKVDKDLLTQKCFVEYEKLHNKLSVPLYSFVIVNFSLPFIVCVIYSILAKPRVNKLESRNTDVEGQDHQASTTQRKLFIQYCCQLATRFCLGIVFILLLLYEVFYPREFPTNFKCNFMREVNQTAANAIGNTKNPCYECINQRAHKKTSWMYAVRGANGILAAFILIEFFIIFSRARKGGKQFVDDSQFYTDHLKSNYDPQNAQLNSLTLAQNDVTDEGAKCLAEALKHSNCKLNSLNLGVNHVTDEGAKCLAEALKHNNCKLNSLNLGVNHVTDKGAKCLAEALKHSNCELNRSD